MKEPFAGRVYLLDNLNIDYYSKISQIAFRRTVTLDRSKEDEYGLTEPSLVLKFISRDKAEDNYMLTVGSSAGGGELYCTYNDNPCIFTVDETSVGIWRDVNVLKTMSRFVTLSSIDAVSRIDLEFGADEKHVIEMKANPGESQGNAETLSHYIDGILADEADYKQFYSVVAGLSIDIDIESDAFTAMVCPY